MPTRTFLRVGREADGTARRLEREGEVLVLVDVTERHLLDRCDWHHGNRLGRLDIDAFISSLMSISHFYLILRESAIE